MNFFKVSDLAIMSAAFMLAAAVESYEVEHVSLSHFLSMRIKIGNFVIFLGLLLLWHVIFSSFRIYNSRRLSNRQEEVYVVLKATTLGTLIIILAAVIFRIQMASLVFILTFWAASSSITIFSRLLLRYALARVRLRGRNLRYMLIAGTNRRAVEFARKIESMKELGYRILGFVDKEWEGIHECQMNGYKVVADFAGFPAFLRNNVVDEVVIALPLKSHYQDASQIVTRCEEQGIVARYLPDIFNTKIWLHKPDHVKMQHLISEYPGAMDSFSLIVKRSVDILVSLLFFILLFPLFLVIALLIKLDSPGPVFFIQDRLGLNKRLFRLCKFRTMVDGAEQKLPELEKFNEVSAPVFKIRNDPRVTRAGMLLRKTSIDEIPQLINVLKGDMSLVGPRPLPVRDYNGFDQDWHRRRFSVRPGLTCLWQVNGRSNIPFEKWMEWDMEYIA